MTVNEPREYTAFCQVLKELEKKKDEYSPRNYRRNTPTATTPPVPVSSWEPNDVEMTMGNLQQPRPNSAVKKIRAKWVSDATITNRRANKLCLRCGASAHMIKECPYLPAQRPAQLPRSVSTVEIAPQLEEEETDEDEDEQEK